jgi:hypothetical protein
MSMEVVFNALHGFRHDRVRFSRSRRYSHARPGGTYDLSEGSQRFGSGGYSASWAVDGEFSVLGTEDCGNDFIGDDRTAVSVPGPFAVVRQNKSDCVSMDGRDWSYVVVIAPDDEYQEMLEEVILEAGRLPSLEEVRDWLDRCLPPEVRAACKGREAALRKEEHEMEDRARREEDEAIWRRCLAKAGKYAGDEATALSVARQLVIRGGDPKQGARHGQSSSGGRDGQRTGVYGRVGCGAGARMPL